MKDLKGWRQNDLKQIRKKVQEHRRENPHEVRRSLKEQIMYADRRLAELAEQEKSYGKDTASYALVASMKNKWAKEKARLVKVLSGQGQKVTQDMIERAKEHPIENILDTKRGFARCVFHEDANPSMYVRNNFAYCFACGKHADTISLYQKIYHCSFTDAVKALQ